MLGVGFATIFAGYWLLTYGFSQVRGCNAGFFEIVWPGSYNGCKADSGGPNANGPLGSGYIQTPGTIGGVTIKDAQQAQSYLNSKKATKAQKEAAGAFLYATGSQG